MRSAPLAAGPSGDTDPSAQEFDDPNLDPDAEDLEEDSPYPEVRSAVANTDDFDMPCATFRAWLVGLVWAIIIPGLNQFLCVRTVP